MSAVEYAPGAERFPDPSYPRLRRYRDVTPRIFKLTQPAAGAEFTVTVPGGVEWELTSMSAVLTCSATVATRQISLALGDGDATFWKQGSTAAPTAGQTARYTWFPGASSFVPAGNDQGTPMAIPRGPYLGGYTFQTATNGLQVGDQWSLIILWVYEISWREMLPEDAFPEDALTWRRQYGHGLLEESI